MLSIRQATLFDLDQLAPLFDGYRMFYEQPSNLQAAREFLLERFRNLESVIFVAEKDTKLIAFTQLYPSFSSVSMRRIWILNDLFVSSDARKLGVGEGLIKHATSFAKASGAKKLVLQTMRDNTTAQKLYSRMEWIRQDEILDFEFAL